MRRPQKSLELFRRRFSFEFEDRRAVSRADGRDNASFVRTNLASSLKGRFRRVC